MEHGCPTPRRPDVCKPYKNGATGLKRQEFLTLVLAVLNEYTPGWEVVHFNTNNHSGARMPVWPMHDLHHYSQIITSRACIEAPQAAPARWRRHTAARRARAQPPDSFDFAPSAEEWMRRVGGMLGRSLTSLHQVSMTSFFLLAQMGNEHVGWLSHKLLSVTLSSAEWVLWLLVVLSVALDRGDAGAGRLLRHAPAAELRGAGAAAGARRVRRR